jgi:ABC-type phosphate transport system substrate-binding protein
MLPLGSVFLWSYKMVSFRKLLTIAVATLALALMPSPLSARETSIAVVVNPGNPTEAISLAQLRNIFLGTQQFWKDGTQVVAVVRAPSARERDVLLRRIVHMSEVQFQEYWRKKQHARAPIVVVSNGMQLETVSKEAGGIALVSSSDLHSGVKVLKVAGRLPGSAAYSLKSSAAR